MSGLLAVTLGFFAFLVVLAWIAVVSVVLYQQQPGPAPAAAVTGSSQM